MGKLYTFKCGCQAEEPKEVEYTVRGRYCPTCFNTDKDHTAQYKCRIQSLDFECEQCGKPQHRNSGATQIFLCHECQHERQQEKQRLKLAAKRAQIEHEREREEQERERLERERQAQERERLAHIERIERENNELKAKLASYEAKAVITENSAPKSAKAKTVNRKTRQKVQVKCPRCRKEYSLHTNEEFNTNTVKWKFCPACASAAKYGNGIDDEMNNEHYGRAS